VKSVVSVPPIQAAGRRRTAKPAAATGPKREGEKKGKKEREERKKRERGGWESLGGAKPALENKPNAHGRQAASQLGTRCREARELGTSPRF